MEMTIDDAKILVEAYMETNRLVREALHDNDKVLEFAKTDEYWQEIINKYQLLKFLKTKI